MNKKEEIVLNESLLATYREIKELKVKLQETHTCCINYANKLNAVMDKNNVGIKNLNVQEINPSSEKIKVFKMPYGWRIITENKFNESLDVIELSRTKNKPWTNTNCI